MSNEDPVTRLAIKVVNLRHALKMTNHVLGKHGLIQLLWAEVRKVKASVLLEGQS